MSENRLSASVPFVRRGPQLSICLASSRGAGSRRSTAGHAHMAGDGGPVVAAVDDEIMPLGLAVDRGADRGFERLVALGLAQRGAQIRRILLAEAHVQR